MTLESKKVSRRDWFAGMAMAALVNNDQGLGDARFDQVTTRECIASEAFALADAMIAASTNDEDEDA